MARRKPKFAGSADWGDERKRRTLRLADLLDEAVWRILSKKKFGDGHVYTLGGPAEVLEDLKACFQHIPSTWPHGRGEVHIRSLRSYLDERPSPRDSEDYIVLEGEGSYVRLYFSRFSDDVHEVYVRLREEGMRQDAAHQTALAVLS